MSFVHQICAKKWYLYGEYLEFYPRIYFRICDRLTLQDISNFQMVLGLDLDASIFNNFIFKFGLDGQLSTLLRGLRDNSLQERDFKGFKKAKKYDSAKLRSELVYFLRLLIQICISEVTFMKQINAKNDGKVDLSVEIQNSIKGMWSNTMKKEAVHLLMLNKLNANIQVLKESQSIEILAKDQVFEDALFEVSTQARDIKNQVTFKLKDELYGWFDPFQYLTFADHAQVF